MRRIKSFKGTFHHVSSSEMDKSQHANFINSNVDTLGEQFHLRNEGYNDYGCYIPIYRDYFFVNIHSNPHVEWLTRMKSPFFILKPLKFLGLYPSVSAPTIPGHPCCRHVGWLQPGLPRRSRQLRVKNATVAGALKQVPRNWSKDAYVCIHSCV